MFRCDCCGLCCMNLHGSDLYDDLNRGDGICCFFDEKTKLCTIYENRPDKCNIDRMYELIFKDSMSREQYYQMNYDACNELKKRRIQDVFNKIK